MRKSFNRLFAILLSLILLIGALYIPMSIFAEEETKTLTFKDYPFSKEDLVFGEVMSIANEEGIGNGDDYALKLSYNGSDVYKTDADGKEILLATRYNTYEHVATVSEGLEDGVTYRLTYDVKIVSSNVGVKITPVTCYNENIWATNFRTAYTACANNLGSSTDGWQKFECTFSANIPKDIKTKNALFLNVNFDSGKEDGKTELLIDNVTVERLDPPYVFFDGQNGKNSVLKKGTVGEKIELPEAPVKIGYDFTGWYTDRECTTAFTDTEYKEGMALTVYAGYVVSKVNFCDFKDYPYSKEDLVFGGVMSIANEKGIGNGDDYALKLSYNGSDVYSVDADGKEILMCTRYNVFEHVATVAEKLENGVVYRISYDYKIISSNVDVKITPVTCYNENIWSSNLRTVYTAAANNIGSSTDGWQSFETVISAQIPAAIVDKNALFLNVTFGSNREDGKTELLIDNVRVERIDPPYIFFDGNNGEYSVLLSGKEGEKIEFPEDPVKTGYDFTGWYTDSECTTPFTDTEYKEGMTLTVYAGYEISQVKICDFKDYPYSKDGLVFGTEFSIANEKGIGIDDDYALRLDYSGRHIYKTEENGNKILMATRYNVYEHKAIVANALEDGAVYKLSYNYKVVSSNTDAIITPVTGYNENIWSSDLRTVYTAAANNVGSKSGDWQSFETYFSAQIPTAIIDKNALFLNVTFASGREEDKVQLLIDNVILERIDPPYIFFDAQNDKDSFLVKGEVGEKIEFPKNPTKFAYSFNGWYTDPECTVAFKETEFKEGMNNTVYAGYKRATDVLVDFENYFLPTREETAGKALYYIDSEIASVSGAKSGRQVARFDRTGEYNAASTAIAIADGKTVFSVEKGRQYVVTLNYRITKQMGQNATISIVNTIENNYWAKQATVSGIETIPADTKVGKWYTATLVVDASNVNEKFEYLYLSVFGGKGGIIDIDDITIKTVPAGKSAVAISRGGCSDLPQYLIGSAGQSFADKLLTNPTAEGKMFIGYYVTDTVGKFIEMTEENYKFGKTPFTVYARFYNLKVTQDFEGTYIDASKEYANYGIYDFDYELYDATKAGNSKDNVTSGNYSLHRKGESQFFENAALLSLGSNIAEGQRYTVTMKVKVGKHFHTDGAIKIVSARNHAYSWNTTGDYYPVASIASIADGQWHEISYTFNAVEGFVSIQTPGYVEVFIDDVEFSLVDKATTKVSTPVSFTEYVPAKRDKDGKIIEFVDATVNVDSIIDASFSTENGINLLFIIIPVGVALLIGAVIFIVLKKKRKGGKA